MKILHTADLHLKEGEPQRLEILKWLIQKGRELKIDAFLIAGDLFDSDNDATILRPAVRRIFEPGPFKILIIPGNHDTISYSSNYDYGQNTIQLTQTPFEIIELAGLNIAGVPYQNKKFSECVINLPRNIDILIIHGTLYDTSFIFSMISDLETAYMPIYPTNLENIAHYVALGHIHSHTFSSTYQNTQVVYPGSPIALDTKCIGKRFTYYIDIDRAKLNIKPLEVENAPYWEEREFFVFPGIEEKILKDIDEYLSAGATRNIMYNIYLKGFIAESDKIFNNSVNHLKEKYAKKFLDLRLTLDNIQSWDKIMQNPLAKKFIERTEGLNNELRKKIFEITLPIFGEITR